LEQLQEVPKLGQFPFALMMPHSPTIKYLI